MRNLAKYPPTKEETVESLRRLAEEVGKKHICGDMRPLLLELAAKAVEKHGIEWEL